MNILKKLFGSKSAKTYSSDNHSEIVSESIQNYSQGTESRIPAVKQYFKTGLFNKFISILVTACFIISIVNLPAFANIEDELNLKKKKDESDKHESVLHQADATYSSPQQAVKQIAMNSLSEKDGVLKQNGKMIGTVVNGKAHLNQGSAGLKYSEQFTNLIQDKVAQEAEKLGLGQYQKDDSARDGQKFVKNNLSDNEIKGKVEQISKATKFSPETVESVLAGFEKSKAKKDKKEDKAVSKPEEKKEEINKTDNILSNQEQIQKAQIKPSMDAATGVMNSVSENVIQKGIMAPVGVIAKAATSVFNADDKNNNNGPTRQMVSDAEQNKALTDVSAEPVNKENFAKEVEAVTEQQTQPQVTEQKIEQKPEQESQLQRTEQELNNALMNIANESINKENFEKEVAAVTEKETEQKEQVTNNQQNVQKVDLSAQIQKDYGYDAENTFNQLSKQTGLDKESIYNEFQKAGVTKEQFTQSSAVLANQLNNGANVVNCSAQALSSTLKNVVSAGVLAIQQLAADIVTGNFLKNNKADSDQVNTSMAAQKQVLNAYGVKADGYSVTTDNLKENLKPGESAIIHVDENHFINVTKNENGSYAVKDNNVNNGKAVNYSEEEFTKLINNQQAKGIDEQGKEITNSGYKATDENGKMNVLTASKNVSEQGTKLTDSQIAEISGAKTKKTTKKNNKTTNKTDKKDENKGKTTNKKKTSVSEKINESVKKVDTNIAKANKSKKAKKIENMNCKTNVVKSGKKSVKTATRTYTENGNAVTFKAKKTVTKQKGGARKIEYDIEKRIVGKDGKITVIKTKKTLNIDKKGVVKGTQSSEMTKDGKLVKTWEKKITGTRKTIKDKKGNRRTVYDLTITGTQTIDGKTTALKEEKRKTESTYRKVNGKEYRTYKINSTIDGKLTTVNCKVETANGQESMTKAVNRDGKLTVYSGKGPYKEETKKAKKTTKKDSSKTTAKTKASDKKQEDKAASKKAETSKKTTTDEKIKEKYGEEGLDAINKISKQTGIDKNTIYKELVKAKVSKDKFTKASKVLLSQMSNGAKIINCSAEALYNTIKKASKALLAIQQLAVDIASGAFFQNNKKGSNKIQTSMSTQKKILNQYGIKADGYSISLSNFKESLKPGESAIVHVNGNHFITVSKNKDGSFTVKDNKVNNGKAVKYSDAEFTKVMKNKYKVTGKLNVLTSSKSVAKKGTKLSESKMKSIAGADHYVTETYTVNVQYTVMEDRTKQVSYKYTGKDGKVHTGTRTVHYKVPVKKTKQVKKTRKKLVKDNKDNKDKKAEEAKKKAAELAKKKAEEEKKRAAALAAKKKAEEARKKAEEAKKNKSKDYAKLERQAKEAERKRIAAEKALKAAANRTKKAQNDYNKAKKEVEKRANKTITKKNKDGSSSVISYDANGEMKSTTNYNKSGKKTSETTIDKSGNSTTTEYAKDGKTKVAQHVTNSATGETVTTNYAKDGKTKTKETINDKDGNLKSAVEYRANGTKLNETTVDKNGNLKTTEYGENGKKIKDILSDKNGKLKSEVAYREDGTKANETVVNKNGDMKTTEYAQDGATKIKETINDKNGNLKSAVEYQKDGVTKKSETSIDKNGNINTTNYDEQGKKTGSTQSSLDAKGNIITVSFDASGKKTGSTVTATDEKGNTTTVIFDANDNKLGSSVTVKNEDGTTTTVNFDAKDQEVSSQTFNAQGKLVNETETLENGKIRSTDYDENGNKIGSADIEKNKDGTLSVTAYDENNNKVEELVTDAKGNVISENKADTGLIDTLAGIGKSFGVDSEAISNVFKTVGVSDEQISQVSSLISEQLSKGAQIVNCAAKATGEALSAVAKPNEFLIGIAQLAVDIVNGDYAKKNTNADGSAKDQIFTTGNAMETVQNMFGLGSQWSSTKVDDLVSNLKENESANIHVDGNHFITATKNKDGSIAVKDPNVNDGKAVNYTEDEFKKLISNQQAKGTDAETGKELTHKGYNATDKSGKVNVLTESKTVNEKGTKLTEAQKKDISGAGLWDRFKSAVSGGYHAAKNTFHRAANTVRSFARNTYHRVRSFARNTYHRVRSFARNTYHSVRNFARHAYHSINRGYKKGGWSGAVSSGAKAVANVGSRVGSAIGNRIGGSTGGNIGSRIGSAVGNFLGGAVGGAVAGWRRGGILGAVAGGIAGGASRVSSILSGVSHTIKSFAKNVLKGPKQAPKNTNDKDKKIQDLNKQYSDANFKSVNKNGKEQLVNTKTGNAVDVKNGDYNTAATNIVRADSVGGKTNDNGDVTITYKNSNKVTHISSKEILNDNSYETIKSLKDNLKDDDRTIQKSGGKWGYEGSRIKGKGKNKNFVSYDEMANSDRGVKGFSEDYESVYKHHQKYPKSDVTLGVNGNKVAFYGSRFKGGSISSQDLHNAIRNTEGMTMEKFYSKYDSAYRSGTDITIGVDSNSSLCWNGKRLEGESLSWNNDLAKADDFTSFYYEIYSSKDPTLKIAAKGANGLCLKSKYMEDGDSIDISLYAQRTQLGLPQQLKLGIVDGDGAQVNIKTVINAFEQASMTNGLKVGLVNGKLAFKGKNIYGGAQLISVLDKNALNNYGETYRGAESINVTVGYADNEFYLYDNGKYLGTGDDAHITISSYDIHGIRNFINDYKRVSSSGANVKFTNATHITGDNFNGELDITKGAFSGPNRATNLSNFLANYKQLAGTDLKIKIVNNDAMYFNEMFSVYGSNIGKEQGVKSRGSDFTNFVTGEQATVSWNTVFDGNKLGFLTQYRLIQGSNTCIVVDSNGKPTGYATVPQEVKTGENNAYAMNQVKFTDYKYGTDVTTVTKLYEIRANDLRQKFNSLVGEDWNSENNAEKVQALVNSLSAIQNLKDVIDPKTNMNFADKLMFDMCDGDGNGLLNNSEAKEYLSVANGIEITNKDSGSTFNTRDVFSTEQQQITKKIISDTNGQSGNKKLFDVSDISCMDISMAIVVENKGNKKVPYLGYEYGMSKVGGGIAPEAWQFDVKVDSKTGEISSVKDDKITAGLTLIGYKDTVTDDDNKKISVVRRDYSDKNHGSALFTMESVTQKPQKNNKKGNGSSGGSSSPFLRNVVSVTQTADGTCKTNAGCLNRITLQNGKVLVWGEGSKAVAGSKLCVGKGENQAQIQITEGMAQLTSSGLANAGNLKFKFTDVNSAEKYCKAMFNELTGNKIVGDFPKQNLSKEFSGVPTEVVSIFGQAGITEFECFGNNAGTGATAAKATKFKVNIVETPIGYQMEFTTTAKTEVLYHVENTKFSDEQQYKKTTLDANTKVSLGKFLADTGLTLINTSTVKIGGDSYKAGGLIIKGDSDGQLRLVNNLEIKDKNVVEFDFESSNAYWKAGAKVYLHSSDITKGITLIGDIEVVDVSLTKANGGGSNGSAGSKGSDNPYFESKYAGVRGMENNPDLRVVTGTFHNISSDNLSMGSLYDAVYAPGSILQNGDKLANGQWVNNAIQSKVKIKENGELEVLDDKFEFDGLKNNWLIMRGAAVSAGVASLAYAVLKGLRVNGNFNYTEQRIAADATGLQAVNQQQAASIAMKTAGKAAIVGLVMAATVVFVAVTGGAGLGVLSGASSSGFTAMSEASLGYIATATGSATITTYYTTSAALGALDAYENGNMLGVGLNILAGLIAFAFPFKIGNIGGNISNEVIKETEKTVIKEVVEAETKEIATRAAIEEAAEIGAKTATDTIIQNGGRKISTEIAEQAIERALEEGGEVAAKAAAKTFSKLGISLSKNVLTKYGLKTSLSSLEKVSNFVKNMSVNYLKNIKNQVVPSLKEGVKNGLNGVAENMGNLLGFNGVGNFVGALNGLSQSMWTMTKLQIAMNAVGQLLEPAKKLFNRGMDLLDNALGTSFFGERMKINNVTWVGAVYNFAFGDMEQQAKYTNNIFAIDPGQSLMFSVAMYCFMPLFQCTFQSVSEMFGSTIAIEEGVADEAIANSFTDFAKNEAKQIVSGIYEEQIKENIIQYGLIGMGVSPEMAEYLSEFLTPDGAGQFNSENFAKKTISNTKMSDVKTVNYQMNKAMSNKESVIGYDVAGDGVGAYTYRDNSGNTNTVIITNDLQLHNAELASIKTAKNDGTATDFYNTYNALNNFAEQEVENINENEGYTPKQAETIMFMLEGINVKNLGKVSLEQMQNIKKEVGEQVDSKQKIESTLAKAGIYAAGVSVDSVQKAQETQEQEAKIDELSLKNFINEFNEQAKVMHNIAMVNDNFKKDIPTDINQVKRVEILKTMYEFKDKYLDEVTGKIDQQKLIDAINTNQENALEDFAELSLFSFMTSKSKIDFGVDVQEVMKNIDIETIKNNAEEAIEAIDQKIIALQTGLSRNLSKDVIDNIQKQIKELENKKQTTKLNIVNTLSGIAIKSVEIEKQNYSGNIYISAYRMLSGNDFAGAIINVQNIVNSVVDKINQYNISETEIENLSSKKALDIYWKIETLIESYNGSEEISNLKNIQNILINRLETIQQLAEVKQINEKIIDRRKAKTRNILNKNDNSYFEQQIKNAQDKAKQIITNDFKREVSSKEEIDAIFKNYSDAFNEGFISEEEIEQERNKFIEDNINSFSISQLSKLSKIETINSESLNKKIKEFSFEEGNVDIGKIDSAKDTKTLKGIINDLNKYEDSNSKQLLLEYAQEKYTQILVKDFEDNIQKFNDNDEEVTEKAKEIADEINLILNEGTEQQKQQMALIIFGQRGLVRTGLMTNSQLVDMVKTRTNSIFEGEKAVSVMENNQISDEFFNDSDNANKNFLSYINFDAAIDSLIGAVEACEEGDFNDFTGGWRLKTKGENLGQKGAVISMLAGGSFGLFAEVGLGKTLIADTVALIRSVSGISDTDLIVQNDSEIKNHLKNEELMKMKGAKVYDMTEIAKDAQNNPDQIVMLDGQKMTAIERLDKIMNEELNAVRIWQDETFGFLRTTAEKNASKGDTKLQDILTRYANRETRLTVADEAHKYMETTMSYVMSDGDSGTLETNLNEKQKEAMKAAYKFASEMNLGEGEEDTNADYFVDNNGQVKFTKVGMEKAQQFINQQREAGNEDITKGKIKSMLQAISEYGSSKYMISNNANIVGKDAVGKLVTMGSGQAQPSMILGDRAYAYAATIQCLTNSKEKGLKASLEKALDNAFDAVRVSRTTYGTSRSGLFYGSGQYVGMSGTMAHIKDLSDIYGMEVMRFGDKKNFSFRADNLVDNIKKARELLSGKQLEQFNSILEEAGFRDNVKFNEKTQQKIDQKIREKLNTEMRNGNKEYQDIYEAYNTVMFKESRNGVDTDTIVKDTVDGAISGMNQLIISQSDQTLQTIKNKINESMKGENIEYEILEINGTTTAEEVKEYINANNNDGVVRIVLANERGGMGLDYEGDWDLRIDSTDCVYSFIHQSLGRVGRHDGELFTRTIYGNMQEIDSLLKDVEEHGSLLEWLNDKFENDDEYKGYEIQLTDEDGKFNDNLSVEEKMLVAKMLKGFIQSSGSLIFGMTDTLDDKCITSAVNQIMTEEGVSDSEKLAILKILDEKFNNHSDGDVVEGKGDFIGGKDQITNSINSKQAEAVQIFEKVASVLSEGKAKNSAEDWLNAWKTVSLDGKTNNNAASMAIVDLEISPDSVQQAVDIMYSQAEMVMPYFGNYAMDTQIKTMAQAEQSLAENDISSSSSERMIEKMENKQQIESLQADINKLKKNESKNKEKIKNLQEEIKKLKNMYVMDKDLTYDGAKFINSYIAINNNSNLKNILTSLLNKENSEDLAKEAVDNDIDVEKLQQLLNSEIVNEENISKLDKDKIKEILNTKHPMGLEQTLSQQGVVAPSATEMKAIELLKKENVAIEKEQQDIYKEYMNVVNKYNSLISDEYKLSLDEHYKLLKESDNPIIKGINSSINLAKTTLGFMALTPLISIGNQSLGGLEQAESFSPSNFVKSNLSIMAVMSASQIFGNPIMNKISNIIPNGVSVSSALSVADKIIKGFGGWMFSRAANSLKQTMSEIGTDVLNDIDNELSLEKLEQQLDEKEYKDLKDALGAKNLIVEMDGKEILTNNGKIIANEVLKLKNSLTYNEDVAVLQHYADINNQQSSNTKELVNMLMKLQSDGVLVRNANEGWTTEVIIEIDKQMSNNRTIENLKDNLKKYRKEGVDIDALPLETSEKKELNTVVGKLMQVTTSLEKGMFDKVKNFAASSVKTIANKVNVQAGKEQLSNEKINKIKQQVQEQENFDTVKENIAQKYEKENKNTIVETVRRLNVENDKVVFKANMNEMQISQENEEENVKKQIIDKIREIDTDTDAKQYQKAYQEIMEKYAETDTKKLSKLIPEITDILLEKANRSMEFSDFEKKIIFSVMRPEESSNIVAAVIAMCKDGNAIAELLGYNSLDEIGSNKEILKQFMSVASEISGLDEKEVSDNDKHLALLVLAAARDILIAVNSSEGKDKTDLINKLNDESLKPSQIEAYLVKSKAVNMNVIVESVTKTDDNTFSVDNENFEIDIQALQRAVEDKNAIAEAERKIKEKDWGAILDMDNFKRGRKEYVPIAFMKLSDIKAVAASA